jgi:hypothetical protein
MRYLKLYEAFKSEILSKTLSFVSPDTKTFFIEKIEAICKSIDFPMSELTDDLFQRMSFGKALDLFVDENHQVGKIKWIKFWFDKEGKYITTTGVDGSDVKADNAEGLADYEIVKNLGLDEIYEELQTGDKVYIKLSYDYPSLIATVFRDYDEDYDEEIVYMIQNKYPGSEPNNQRWKKYGLYSWIVSSQDDFVGVPQLLKLKYLDEEKNTHSYNFLLNTYGRMSLRKSETSETYLKKASFAIVLDFDALQSSTYKTKSSIETERTESKKGALAFMTDNEIKSKNLQRYFSEIAKNIKFSEDLSNIKSLMVKLLGGNKLFMYIFRGQFSPLIRLIQEVYSFIRISETNSQNEYTLDVKRTIIYSIEKNIKETYEDALKKNTERDKLILDLKKFLRQEEKPNATYERQDEKVKLILKIIDNFEKLVNDFNNAFRNLKIETLDDVEIVYYKLLSVCRFINDSQRFYTLKSNFSIIIDFMDVNSMRHRLSRNNVQELEEVNKQMEQFTPLALKLLQ